MITIILSDEKMLSQKKFLHVPEVSRLILETKIINIRYDKIRFKRNFLRFDFN